MVFTVCSAAMLLSCLCLLLSLQGHLEASHSLLSPKLCNASVSVYGFVERVVGIRPSVRKSVTLAEFCKHVLADN